MPLPIQNKSEIKYHHTLSVKKFDIIRLKPFVEPGCKCVYKTIKNTLYLHIIIYISGFLQPALGRHQRYCRFWHFCIGFIILAPEVVALGVSLLIAMGPCPHVGWYFYF